MPKYMPLKFPLELRQPLLNKQEELSKTIARLAPTALSQQKKLPFTKVFKAVLENKQYITDEYLIKLARGSK